jgi:hypothetical protein
MGDQPEQPAWRKRLLPPTCLLLAIVALTALHFLLPWRQVIRFPWRLLGTAPLLAGIVLNLAADRHYLPSGSRYTLRNSMGLPSLWRQMGPLAGSASVPSFWRRPLTVSFTVPPSQTMS